MTAVKRLAASVLCIIMFAVSAGCSDAQKNDTAESAAICFTDDDGTEISLEKPAERIISLYSAHTENLYSLGAGDSLIGNYHTAVYPPEAAELDMYDYSEDPEKVIAAAPDLVLIRPFITRKVPDFVSALRKAGICVASLYPDSPEDFDEYIERLALLTGTEEKAEKLLSDFHTELDEIRELTKDAEPKQRVFFEATGNDIRTVTPDSLAGMAIETAGGINAAADAAPAKAGSSVAEYGIERVLEKADEIDVYVSQSGEMNTDSSPEAIAQRGGFGVIKAVKEGRVYTIDEKLISSPTFRYAEGVRELAHILYPERVR